MNSATGLLKQILLGNIKFLSAVYLLHEEIERVWKAAEALDPEVDFLEQENEHAEALLKLRSGKEGTLGPVSEWEHSDSV